MTQSMRFSGGWLAGVIGWARCARLGGWARHAGRGAAALLVSAGLLGCAAMNQLSAEVSSFGAWPAGRAPGSYAFDRLPSQQARPAVAQALEDSAALALAKAGFRPVASGAQADVMVQLGARVQRQEASPWDDPLWWPGSGWRHLPWRGPLWLGPPGSGWRHSPARYEREVALLIRDRATGQPLYEARASSDGLGRGAGSVLVPMFSAALIDFPAARGEPHRVSVVVAP